MIRAPAEPTGGESIRTIQAAETADRPADMVVC